jgi:hypothetical protein
MYTNVGYEIMNNYDINIKIHFQNNTVFYFLT